MSEDNNRPLVIRRVKKIKKGGHHGGAWKIAYADFVTAMMAFFLLMWVLGLLNKYQLQGVAAYFKKPLKEVFEDHPHQKNIGIDKNKEKEKEKEKEKNKEKLSIPGTQIDKKTMSAIDIKNKLLSNLNKDPQMEQYKNHLNFVVTAEGLKIELHDLDNKPMFASGKADFEEYANKIVAWLSNQLNQYPNQVTIIGHTDTKKYSDGSNEEYSNWELSADRANATRRELIRSGMNENKVIRVIGEGDTDLYNKLNGEDPANRRIEIIVLTDEARRHLQNH